mmetsp:Transcript_30073/g.46010  ORF Transcript_30073/g.46010 Transcript_30073/m.46010 type:complete len:185 (-) Transcript_30073:192-746(-)
MPDLSSIKEKAARGMNRAANAVGIERTNTQDSNTMDEIAEFCPKLTYQQRMIGFGSCFVLGYLITFTSFNYFEDLILGNPVPFVLVYTLGNIISLFSAMFLCGPKRQFKNMFDDKRKTTTIVYLSTLLLSIIVAFIPFESSIKLSILLLLLFVQFFSSIWYSLSYIPFARKAVKKCFRDNTENV